MNELAKRVIFGLVYIAVMLSAVLVEGVNLYVFSFLAFVGIWEYSSLVGLHRTRPLRTIFDGLAAVYLVLSMSFSHSIIGAVFSLAPYCVYLFYIFIRSMYGKTDDAVQSVAKIILGQIYIGVPLSLASVLTYSSQDSLYLLSILICIWLNDTGAFVFGSRFGKRRLFPSLSPKKSWEGFWGGLFCSAVASVIMSVFVVNIDVDHSLEMLLTMAFLGAVISISATWGDLFESMLKRQAGVKDSGRIIPGHGGVLDRIDSLLFTVPMASLTYLILLLR